jgi:protein-arginine kinase activator protein McsA
MEQAWAIDNSDETDGEELSEEEYNDIARRLDLAFDSMEELEQKLQKAIDSEDFEMASIIRDEIKERGKD